jgi:predicted TIM-barrel fold metal-dependent hydrolase
MAAESGRMTKGFPVFDCDAHVNDPLEIWERYVPDSKKELVSQTYWRSDAEAFVNGTTPCIGGGNDEFAPMYNPILIAGPQMNKRIMRKLMTMMPLSDQQREYLRHAGGFDAKARVGEMDLMGIDQVLVIPTMVIMNLPFAENPEGVEVFCRAYNDWCADWCAEVPGRLFPAALLPLQDPERAATEVRRVAERGFPVGLVRPIDARGAYPNDIGRSMTDGRGGPGHMDVLFRAFEETGMVLGMHTFPAGVVGRTAFPGALTSPGELVNHAGVDSQTLSFIFEMQTWLAQVLLGGFLDRYRELKMAVFESNSQWLPYMLETCDRLFEAYANERQVLTERLPSQAFYDQCVISFESDEEPTMAQWDRFDTVGIWASDCYHHDGADAWSAIGAMRSLGVPEETQSRMMGGNAARFYGVEQKLFVTEEPPSIDRPDWFPEGPEFDEWAELVARPRENADAILNRAITSAPPVPINAARRQGRAGTY